MYAKFNFGIVTGVMRFERQQVNVQEGESGSIDKQQKAAKRQVEEY